MSERYETPMVPGTGLRGPAELSAFLITIAIALFAFWAAWVSTRASAPTTMFIAFGVLTAAIAAAIAFFRPVLNIQDFYGGLAMVAIAIFALYASADLPGMRGFSFGPGTAPRLFGMLLGGLG